MTALKQISKGLPANAEQTLQISFQTWTAQRLAQSESALDSLLPKTNQLPQSLHEGMRYAVLDGGKRIRPLLTYAACEWIGGDGTIAALAGSAVEMIHAYSLVHDDMPCMDNDVLRRGKATVHVAFGEANAMLVGDSLQPLAFETLANLINRLPGRNVVQLVQMLARASGSLGMAGGQAIDLSMVGLADASTVNRTQLEQMQQMKTGALLRCAVLMGAWCQQYEPSAHQIAALETYSGAIGLAFQVVDDILDVSSDTTTLGKTAGKDQQDNKPTYVSLLGLDQARLLASQLYVQAIEALDQASENTNQRQQSRRLREIADLIVSRRS